MHDDGHIRTVLACWGIVDGVAWQALHHKGTVVLVTTAASDQLVLKEVGDATQADRLYAEYELLLHLHGSGVPVAMPLPVVDGLPFATYAGKLYTLAPYLLAGAAEGSMDLKIAYANLGSAIAALHEALATYPGTITSWTMDLPARVFDDAVPVIRAHLEGREQRRFEHVLGEMGTGMRGRLADLPLRRIHGDCHTGNVLLHGNTVAGFVDFDHLPVGPASYDICYALVDHLKQWVADAEQAARWLGAFDRAVVGYKRVLGLSAREERALWSMMLAIQLLFASWMFLHGNRVAAGLNMQAFYWLYEHRDEITRRVLEATGGRRERQ
jgi:Ser/Thr protein kinase RdoA (MazF antagonist)